jgi:ABC-type antimicrobial peptide transport system permease subunit
MLSELVISIKLAINNLRANLGRTVLTLVGVVIGVLAVILVSALGQGVKEYVLNQVSSFGTDLIQVEVKVPATKQTSTSNAVGQATGIQITTLTLSDADALGKLPNIKNYYAASIGQELVSYQNFNKQIVLFGAGAQVPEVDANFKLKEGAFYSEVDDRDLAQVAVIGSDISDAFFGGIDPVGKEIKIKDQKYRIIGVLAKRGTVGFFNFDEIIYIPVRTLQKKILGVNYVRMIGLRVSDQKVIDETTANIIFEMRKLHKITDPSKDDFGVMSIKDAQNTIDSVFNTINILLLALTSISLLVGGVGIMNIMYVAVAERTFEIGLRKAVGAKAKNILRQFLWEAIFITFFGGLIGIILGYLLLLALSYLASSFGYPINLSVSANAVFLAVGFSFLTGIIFGYYPARAASRLSPMEALRKE